MKKNLFAALALAIAVATIPSCSDESSSSDLTSTFSQTTVETTTSADGDVSVVEIEGIIYNETVTFDASTKYMIASPVIVGEGATLNIPAGTTIYAKPGFASYLLVLQGGKIYAEGTSSAPINFKSTIDGSKWGGLIINGYATISGTSSTGNTGSTEIASKYKYGGSNDSDNSGVLTYIILSDTGANDGADVEHNGLTLNGVGNGTKIENIYVDATLDDGIEFFGGCVNVTNLLVVNPDDDMFDFTQGYTGTLTNAYGIWTADHTSSEEDPRGVEADGNLDGSYPDHFAQSDFVIDGMTIVNNRTAAATQDDDKMHDAIKLRRGAKAEMKNVRVAGIHSASDLIDVYDKKGTAKAGSSFSIYNTLSVGDVLELGVKEQDSYADIAVASDYTLTENTTNTGADTSVFSWTGFSFPTL